MGGRKPGRKDGVRRCGASSRRRDSGKERLAAASRMVYGFRNPMLNAQG